MTKILLKSLKLTTKDTKMNKLHLFLAVLLFTLSLQAQDADQNFTKVITYKKPTTQGNVDITNPADAAIQVTYYDGLGRPIQQIAHKQAANGKDIVTHIEYDQFGRQIKDYLPYTTSSASLSYNPNGQTDVMNYYASTYNVNTTVPYSEKQLENSPLSRVLKQAAPGESWALGSNNEIKMEYQTNADNDVKLFTANATWDATNEIYNISLVQNSFYAKNQLYKTVTKDENWKTGVNNTSEEFKNKRGQVILKRTYNNSVAYDTYYVYDQYDNLTYVIPPLAAEQAAITQTILDNLCYQYKYDSRNRLVAKAIPGKQWEYIVYNKVNLPVATGPAFSPFGGTNTGWIITKYDGLNRPISTGWFDGLQPTAAGRLTFQNKMNSAGDSYYEAKALNNGTNVVDNITISYTDKVYPRFNNEPYKLLSVNYYDDYNFPHANLINYTVTGVTLATSLKGLPTGSWVRVLEGEDKTNAEQSYTLYDDRYRPVRSYTKNHLGGFTQVDTSLDWAGKTLQIITTHKRKDSDQTLTTTETFEYTDQDRLYIHKHQVNGEPEETLTENFYDPLGQLITKNTGSYLQEVNYKYNIRGWLTSINDKEIAPSEDGYVQLGSGDLFAFKVSYDDVMYPVGNVERLYNGNISETQWVTSTDNTVRHYGYSYDHLNRLEEAIFIQPKIGGEENAFNESLQYDKNGNITHLERNGKIYSDITPIDILSYTYEYNKLKTVKDDSGSPQGFNDGNPSGTDYVYDSNGNLISDANKKITSITYNHLNLPTHFQFANGNNIDYLYNAIGTKVSKKVKTGAEYADTDYLTGYQYRSSYTQAQGDQSTAELQYFPHAEGYVLHKEGKFFYVYHYTDHLGNIRLSYTYDNDTSMIRIMEENHYYPFGLKHDSYNTQHLGYSTYTDEGEITNYVLEEVPKFVGDGSFAYKFGNKELQDELGLNMYDYGARNYDPALGRWMNIDPLSETSRRWTPYNYAYNNPMYFVDPDGMQANDWVYVNDEMKYDSRVTDQASATELYGEEAKYHEVGYSYTSREGDNIVLGDLGFFKDNGVLGWSYDMASTEGQISEVNKAYAGSALVLSAITADGVTPEPTDAAVQKWIAYAVVGTIAGAVIMKRDAEIDGILDRAIDGPPGVQYSLRANSSGEYPIMSSGSSVPTGTMHLNAGDVWKYGETTNPSGRYSADDLSTVGAGGVTQYNEFTGTQTQVKAMEKVKIYNYFITNGQLPPGNKIFR